jgi:hypothetical protein
MAEETVITWNAANWITILLMVAIGVAVLGFVSKWVQSRSASKAA